MTLHDSPAASQPGSPFPLGVAPSILVIDDDRKLCAILCQVLKSAGYEADGALDGQMGLRLYGEKKYDLVVSDMLMPNCDGVELIAAIRKQNPNAAIIAISGGGLIGAETYLHIAESFGIKTTLRKPFDMPSFIALVNRVFNPN